MCSSLARLEYLRTFVPALCRPGGSKHCGSSSTRYGCATSHATGVVNWRETGCTPRIEPRCVIHAASNNITVYGALHGVIHRCINRWIVAQRLGCVRAVAITFLATDAASLREPESVLEDKVKSSDHRKDPTVGSPLTKGTADLPFPGVRPLERNRPSGRRSCSHHLPSAKIRW